MFAPARKFANSEGGNFAIIAAVLMVPILLGVGLAIDYSMASTTRSDMQNALDAAAFAALSLPDNVKKKERQEALQAAYLANGGQGQALIDKDIVVDDTGTSLKVTSTYKMPTNFMGIGGKADVDIGVVSSVTMPMKLSKATFELDGVTGAWDKTVTLMGRPEGGSAYVPLLRMVYIAKSAGGWGDTTLSVLGSTGAWSNTFSIQCTSMSACTKTKLTGDGSAQADMSNMDDVYMEMYITADVGKIHWPYKFDSITLKTTEPGTWESMFVEEKQMPPGPIDLLHAFGCSDKSLKHRWEDGGGHAGTSAWDGTDFRYSVKGKCTSNAKAVRLTN